MTNRALALMVLVSTVLSACAQPALTVAEYAAAMDEATDAYIAEAQSLSATFQGAVEDEVRRIVEKGSDDPLGEATDITRRETVLYLALLEDAMDRYVERLSEIDPPSEVEGSHADYVAAVGTVHRAMPSSRSSVASAIDIAGIKGALAASGFQDGQYRLTSACLSLEELVRAEGSGIDLGCTRPPEVDIAP